jgi:hypothetical protein
MAAQAATQWRGEVVISPPLQHRSRFSEWSTERTFRKAAALCGIAGPIALTVYFATPAFSNWPYAGASPANLTAYALDHQSLFYAGAWFQATGTLLCIIFFLAIVQQAGATARLSGVLVVVSSTALLGLVLVESALLVAVPMAAASGDTATVVTTFDLSNGVFVRVFPLAPAPVSFLALGAVILGSRVLDRRFGYAAIGVGIAFEVAGILAVFSSLGLILTIVLSITQEFWIVAAAIALWRSIRSESGSEVPHHTA